MDDWDWVDVVVWITLGYMLNEMMQTIMVGPLFK